MLSRITLALAVLAAAPAAQENVLLLIGDDVGVDRIAAYEAHPDPGRTPVIDRLAAEGMLFRNAWAHPSCSPTRAAVLTGRSPFRHGIGSPVKASAGGGLGQPGGHTLSLAEWTLPEILEAGTDGAWTSVVLGKWHLAELAKAPLHPLQSGFERHAGSLFNLGVEGGTGYFDWIKTVNGAPQRTTVYATTDTADDAIAAIRRLPEPWFVWVAFNAPHKPYHAPPDHLHDFDLAGDPNDTPIDHHKAMVQALDTEIGRVLCSVDPAVLERTTIVFLGDNGTQNGATQPPFPTNHGKGSVYQGGVHVPLIVRGPRVRRPGSECDALVQATDLFATVAQIAGVNPEAVVGPDVTLDSVSLLPYLAEPQQPSLRSAVFAESFKPNGFGSYIERSRAVRGPRYKLIAEGLQGVHELYDLARDPFEQVDLLAGALTPKQALAYQRLQAELAAATAP